MKRILALRKSLQVVVHSGSGQPVAVRVNIPRLAAWLSTALVAYALLGGGTLLFFRELEINRNLQTRLLIFETNEKLWQTSWNTPKIPAPAPVPNSAPASAVKTGEKIAKTAPTAAVATPAPLIQQPATEMPAVAQPVAPPPAAVMAKISELSNQCGPEECQVRLALSTTGTGVAEGFLLIVLEAEVPRIGGAATPEAQMRKRYFLYPEQEPLDEIDPAAIAKLQQKSFRFSRGLKTTAAFKVGKLLRPLSVNAYLFDGKHTQLQHERRAITDEP